MIIPWRNAEEESMITARKFGETATYEKLIRRNGSWREALAASME
ncbi:hypothetical protein A2U01_0092828 [Trifolium medium]|uniref:Uncharacterized protein n=1 Tax=Trifolium medium TaxID=97028 RepID=A0A392UIK4_9FABA|nr:hypothetical protein [Trifolium medium]